MNSNNSRLKRFVYLITFLVLAAVVFSSSAGIALGQKMPKSVPIDDVNADDNKLCQDGGSLRSTQFCTLFRSYESNITSKNYLAARDDRNEMIKIVRGQIDSFYKQRKDKRNGRTRFFQTLLDFLEIGGALAVTIMNGERAKSIVGAGIAAMQGGRTAFNRNFQLLQTQTLINTMNANRATILTEIVGSFDKPVHSIQNEEGEDVIKPSDTFSWYDAKNDLRRYLLAGTIDNALDELLKNTGADVAKAEKQLRRVENKIVAGTIAPGTLAITTSAAAALTKLNAALKGTNAKAKQKATETLQAIVTELNENSELKDLLKAKQITADSKGADIIQAIIDLRGELLDEDEDLVDLIDAVIVDKSK